MAARARRAGRRCATRTASTSSAEGDLVCFPEGPDGAHKVTNRTEEPVRILMLSTSAKTAVAVYPDSNKVGVWPLGKLFRIEDAVDYYDGEL